MYRLIKLNFNSPVHFGKSGVGLEETDYFAHSDTIFSAFCNAWTQLFGGSSLEEDVLARFMQDEIPFKISSAFPYLEDTYFLPRPGIPCRGIDDLTESEEFYKLLKKTDFIPFSLFQKWVYGTMVNRQDFKLLQESRERLLEDCFQRYETPRAQLDRATAAAGIYHCGLVRYAGQAGLYFILQIEPEGFEQFKRVLKHLGERGLGGQLANGCGKFTFKALPLTEEWQALFEPDFVPGSYCLLSLFNPGAEDRDIPGAGSAYELIMRRGWAYSRAIKREVRKKLCRMFNEGSVFSRPVKGRLVDITPEGKELPHKFYRYGIPLTAGLRADLL